MAFLRAEEERIQTDKTISAGGAKQRAEQQWLAYRNLEKAFLKFRPEYIQPPPVRIRPKNSLRMSLLGGSGEVGGSCHLLELGKHRILVDCGIKPSDEQDLYPDIDWLERLDALILTHAHTDHIGWVPALIRRFPNLQIYCSEGTAALLPVMLEDCRDHYVRKMTKLRERAKYISNAQNVIDAYDEEDVLGGIQTRDHVSVRPRGEITVWRHVDPLILRRAHSRCRKRPHRGSEWAQGLLFW
jgi:hypothetical protein